MVTRKPCSRRACLTRVSRSIDAGSYNRFQKIPLASVSFASDRSTSRAGPCRMTSPEPRRRKAVSSAARL